MELIQSANIKQYSNSITNNSALFKFIGVLIALVPILMPYRIPALSYSIASVLATLLAVIMIPIIICRLNKIDFSYFFLFLLFLFYAFVKSSGVNLVVLVFTSIILIGLTTGAVDSSFFRKTIEIIAIAASIAVLFQTLSHYIVGGHIPLIIPSLCTESVQSSYSNLILTGMASRLYRPSAFFLEPSHFTQFCVFALVSSLFRKKARLKTAFLISLGMLATTSGMGIIMILVSWAFWLFIYNLEATKRNLPKYLIMLLVALLLFIFVYQIPFIQQAVLRVTEGEAIKGRWFWWDKYFSQFNISDLTFGFGTSSLPSEYFIGFMSYIWSYGIIGFTLYSIGCIQMFFKSKIVSKYLILLIFSLMFFANATSVVGLLFNYGAIVILRNESR